MIQASNWQVGVPFWSGFELLGQSGSFWLPAPESVGAEIVDWVFYLILAVCTFFSCSSCR